jgi:uncharacterized membrane protein YjfL (UPF0719 family)
MHILDNIPIRLALFSSIYLIILIFLAPFIDHLFTSLEEDKAIKENNYQILAEIIIHAMVLTVTWYFLHKYLSKFLESVLDVKIKEATKSAIDFISAIALVGLQRNLIDKLEYITFEHPFRVKDLYE